VTQTMNTGRSDPTGPQLFRYFMTPRGRLVGAFICIVIILGIAIGSYFLAWTAGGSDLRAANLRVVQVQNENQRLLTINTNQLATITDLQSQIKSVQAKLSSIMPSENTYNINPNQALIVAGGRLTIGLVGSPSNETVNININGKPQAAAAGAVINAVLDPTTTCQVGVQSFDMFRAVLTATCADVKQ
jgi:hypothetical protein